MFQSSNEKIIPFSQCSLSVLPAQGRLPKKMVQARGSNIPTPTMTRLPIPSPHALPLSLHPHMVGCQGGDIKCHCVWYMGWSQQEAETQQWALTSVECIMNQTAVELNNAQSS